MYIVCLGDSLTAGTGVAPALRWTSLLAQCGHRTENAGLCGDTASGMLVRLHSDVLPRMPQAVILTGGTCDILLTGDAYAPRSAIFAMVQHCAACGVRPVIGIPAPISPQAHLPACAFSKDAAAAARAMEEYCAWLRVLCAQLKLRMVDFGQALQKLAGEKGWQAALLADGIHPSEQGHAAMAHTAAQRFAAWCQKSGAKA